MVKKLILAVTLCSSTSAFGATKSDAMKWEAGYQVLSAIDAAETIYCTKKISGCEEANPLFGKHPSTAKIILTKVLIGGAHFILIDRMANRDPKAAMRIAQISVVLQGTVVGLNARIIFK